LEERIPAVHGEEDVTYKNGIQIRNDTCSVVRDIEEVIEGLGFDNPFPFDRSNSTYFHVSPSQVREWLEQGRDGPFSQNAYVVVPVEEIEHTKYMADMSVITDLIDYKYGGSEQMLYAETPTEVIDKYKKSIQRVSDKQDIHDYESPFGGKPELIIEGEIDKTQIHTIFAP
jgi:hypothetical protein